MKSSVRRISSIVSPGIPNMNEPFSITLCLRASSTISRCFSRLADGPFICLRILSEPDSNPQFQLTTCSRSSATHSSSFTAELRMFTAARKLMTERLSSSSAMACSRLMSRHTVSSKSIRKFAFSCVTAYSN